MIRAAADPRPRPKLVSSKPAPDESQSSAAILKSYIDRIIRLHEERKGLSEDISEILAEAKSRGFDRKGITGTVKRLMGDEVALTELDAIIDLYLRRYRETGTDRALTHTSAPAQPFDADTGEITDTPISQQPGNSGELDTTSCGGTDGGAVELRFKGACALDAPGTAPADEPVALRQGNQQAGIKPGPQETHTDPRPAVPGKSVEPIRSTVDGRILTVDPDRKHVPTFEGLEIPDFLRRAQPQGSA